jgi:hypothetical protein
MPRLSATASRGCAARAARCKVNDGVDVDVAVKVKVGVEVKEEDNVNSIAG